MPWIQNRPVREELELKRKIFSNIFANFFSLFVNISLQKFSKNFCENAKNLIYLLNWILHLRPLEKEHFLSFVYYYNIFCPPCKDSSGQPGEDSPYRISGTEHLAEGM